MKPKTMVLMVVAVVCGLGASYMTSKLLAERNNQQQEEDTVTVLVAKQKIAKWAHLKDPQKLFEEKVVPKSQAEPKAVTRLDELKDKRVSVDLKTGNQISTDDLTSAADGLQNMIPQGHRAYAIPVSPATAASGFILPNCRVDVISTVSRGEQSYTQTILQNVLVLGINRTSSTDGQTQAMPASTVTVAVTPEDVQSLSLAGSQSELKLSLRPIGETEIVNQKKTTFGNVGKRSNPFGLPGAEGARPSNIFTLPTQPDTKSEDLAKGDAKKTEEPKAEEPKSAEKDPVEAKPEPFHVMTIINGKENPVKVPFFKNVEGEVFIGDLPEAKDCKESKTPEHKTPSKPAKQPEAKGAVPISTTPVDPPKPAKAGVATRS